MRSLMQSKPRLPNVLSFIGRLGNMELMHIDCQGPLGSYPRPRDPQTSQSSAHGKTDLETRLRPAWSSRIVSRGVVWIGG